MSSPKPIDCVPQPRTFARRSRLLRLVWLGALVLPGPLAIGCGSNTSNGENSSNGAGEENAPRTDGVCPPDQPDCDRLDQPCVTDDEEPSADSIGPTSSPMGLTTDQTSTGKYRVWPKGRIPYKIDSSVGSTTKGRLLDAMAEWQSKSQQRVRFEKATSSDSTYLVVYSGSLPITSPVGYRSGTISKVHLRNPEYITVIRHELGHVLGLQHEQRRTDRSDYILVKSSNIVDTNLCKSQFNVCTDCVPIGKYNITSVMHYRTTDLSNCRTGPVLLHLDGSPISHTWLINSGDLAAIAELYGPPPTAADAGVTGDTSDGGGTPEAGIEPGNGGTAGAGGSVGSGGSAGSGGDGIDIPDEPPPGGTSGTAGTPGTPGTPGAKAADDSSVDGGCTIGGKPDLPSKSIVIALGLLALGRFRRSRTVARSRAISRSSARLR